MGTPGHRFSIRNWLTLIGIAAASAAAIVVMASVGVGASVAKIALTAGDPITAAEGNLVEGQVVAHFTDADNVTPSISAVARLQVVNCADNDAYTASINWGDGSTATAGTVSCSGQDTWDVVGSHTYKDSGTFKVTVTVNDSDGQTASAETDGATISDATVRVVGDNSQDEAFVAVESAKVTVSVDFSDNNFSYGTHAAPVDPGVTATVDWGDGKKDTVTPIALAAVSCECRGFTVTASHVYDARSQNYAIAVTAKDDGGSTATDELSARISDAKLTAGAVKSFVAPAAQASSPVVASFTDAAAAQAAVGDFTATITWGDGASSAGTFTQTASGAFDVKGTHTYATAGTKSLTIKVTDEEGQTLSMTATATVPALPITGQPQTPMPPSMPLLPLAVLVLGLAVAGGAGFVLRRIRN